MIRLGTRRRAQSGQPEEHVETRRKLLLVLPDFTAPFFAEVINAVEREAHDLGWDIIAGATLNDRRRERRLLASADAMDVVGTLLVTNNPVDLDDGFHPTAPLVAIVEPVSGLHSVTADFVAMGAAAASHLSDYGHRTFAFIGGEPFAASTTQLAGGFSQVAQARIRQPNDMIAFLGSHSVAHGYDAVLRLARERRLATGIFAGSSLIAQGVMRAAASLRLSIPRDLSLICYDGAGPIDLLAPPVTSVSFSLAEMASRAISLLRRPRLPRQATARVISPYRLVERNSSDRPRQFNLLRNEPANHS